MTSALDTSDARAREMKADEHHPLGRQAVQKGEAGTCREVTVEIASEGPGGPTERQNRMAQGIPSDQHLLPSGFDEDGGVAGRVTRRRNV